MLSTDTTAHTIMSALITSWQAPIHGPIQITKQYRLLPDLLLTGIQIVKKFLQEFWEASSQVLHTDFKCAVSFLLSHQSMHFWTMYNLSPCYVMCRSPVHSQTGFN